MVRCVDIKSFEAQMAALQPTETEVIISVIENFIETAVITIGPDGKEEDGTRTNCCPVLHNNRNRSKEKSGLKVCIG